MAVTADQGAVGAVAHADVGVLPGEDHFVDTGSHEGARSGRCRRRSRSCAWAERNSSRGGSGRQGRRSPERPGCRPWVCSPQTASSGSSGLVGVVREDDQPALVDGPAQAVAASAGTRPGARGLASAPSTKSFSMSMITRAFIRLLFSRSVSPCASRSPAAIWRTSRRRRSGAPVAGGALVRRQRRRRRVGVCSLSLCIAITAHCRHRPLTTAARATREATSGASAAARVRTGEEVNERCGGVTAAA